MFASLNMYVSIFLHKTNGTCTYLHQISGLVQSAVVIMVVSVVVISQLLLFHSTP